MRQPLTPRQTAAGQAMTYAIKHYQPYCSERMLSLGLQRAAEQGRGIWRVMVPSPEALTQAWAREHGTPEYVPLSDMTPAQLACMPRTLLSTYDPSKTIVFQFLFGNDETRKYEVCYRTRTHRRRRTASRVAVHGLVLFS